MEPSLLFQLLLPYVRAPESLRVCRVTEDVCLQEILTRKRKHFQRWKGQLWLLDLWHRHPDIIHLNLLENIVEGFYFIRNGGEKLLQRRTYDSVLRFVDEPDVPLNTVHLATKRYFVLSASMFCRSTWAEEHMVEIMFEGRDALQKVDSGGPEWTVIGRTGPVEETSLEGMDWDCFQRVEISRPQFLQWVGHFHFTVEGVRRLLRELTAL